jgi:CheY-like chemotaxis protein
VHVAWTGEQALDYLFGAATSATASASDADLVLLDLKLPGIDGQEVLRQVKSTPGSSACRWWC